MTQKEVLLAAAFLRLAADEFGNHGCNDLDEAMIADFSPAERRQFAREFSAWNGDPEEERRMEYLGDYSIMAYLAAKLTELARAK